VIEQLKKRASGLALSCTVGLAAYALWLVTKSSLQISSLLWAFLLSLVLGNATKMGTQFAEGIRFASSRLLRVTVGALGIVVSASAWWKLGGTGLAVVLANLALTLALGYIFCRVLLRMSMKQALLIMTGTAICGASAIAATAPAIEAEEEDTALALAVITMFGLAAMFLYPLLFNLSPIGQWLGNEPSAFGLWSGVGIHETAQVIASASQVEGALELATLAKSVRIFMIGPVVLLCAALFRRSSESGISEKGESTPWPWFALVFVVLTFVHAGLEAWIGPSWVQFSKTWLSPPIKFFLTWAFAAVGLRVRFRTLRRIGGKAFAAGLLVATAAGVSALLLTRLLWL